MICEKCKANIPDNTKFCPKCGAKVEIIKVQETKKCPSCGAENPPFAKFCKVDGYNFQQAQERLKDVIICPKCGTENPTIAKFCRKDGVPLKEEIKQSVLEKQEIVPEVVIKPEAAVIPTKINVKKKAKAFSKILVWIAVYVLIFTIAGMGSYLYFVRQTAQKSEKLAPAPQITKPSEVKTTPQEVKKPPVPQEPETKTILPTTPVPEPTKPPVDIARIEKDLNKALRSWGLSNVYATVHKDLTVNLKGTVNDPRDKMLASNIAKSFTQIKEVENEIVVVEQPLAPTPQKQQEPPLPSPPPTYKTDPTKLERDINMALRNAGLKNITAEVNDNLEVTLKGSVGSNYEKGKAFEIVKKFSEVKGIKDIIFVIEQ